MKALKLLLTADIGDILTAATEAREWAKYITAREGCNVSAWATFLALTSVRPWRIQDPNVAPWRVVRAAIR